MVAVVLALLGDEDALVAESAAFALGELCFTAPMRIPRHSVPVPRSCMRQPSTLIHSFAEAAVAALGAIR